MTSFLRKANRQLRSASLVALEALAAKYGRQISAAAVAALVPEAAALISDAGERQTGGGGVGGCFLGGGWIKSGCVCVGRGYHPSAVCLGLGRMDI